MRENGVSQVKEDTEEMKNGEVRARVKWTNAGRIRLKEWKQKSWTSTRLKKAKKRLSEVEGAPPEWRRVRKSKKYITRKW